MNSAMANAILKARLRKERPASTLEVEARKSSGEKKRKVMPGRDVKEAGDEGLRDGIKRRLRSSTREVDLGGAQVETPAIREVEQEELGGVRKLVNLVRSVDFGGAVGLCRVLEKDQVREAFEVVVKEEEHFALKVGRILVKLGEREWAQEYYERAVDFDSVSGYMLKLEGDLIYDEEEFELACELYKYSLRERMFGFEQEERLIVLRLYQHGYREEVLRHMSLMCEDVPWEGNVLEFAGSFFGQSAEGGGDLVAVDFVVREECGSARECVERFEWLIGKARGEVVLEYVKRGLEKCLEEEDDEKLKEELPDKLRLAVMLGEKQGFDKLVERCCGGDYGHDAVKDFTSGSWPSVASLMDFHDPYHLVDSRCVVSTLLGRFCVSKGYGEEAFIEQWGVIRPGLEGLLKSLLEQYRLFNDILRAAGVLAVEDPRFKIHLFSHKERGENWKVPEILLLGRAHVKYRKVAMTVEVGDHRFGGVLLHELTHVLMHVLYSNGASPHSDVDGERKQAYVEVVSKVEALLDSAMTEESDAHKHVRENFQHMRKSYRQEEHGWEYIARYPEMVAYGFYGDEQARELLLPLKEYWDKYVVWDLKAYILSLGR